MPAIGFVVTIDRAAEILNEDEELLFEIACEMTPAEGCVNIYGADDAFTVGFTADGVDRLKELVSIRKQN